MKSEADLASEKAWLDAEKVWLNHSEGFSAGRVLKRKEDQGSADDSTCLVKLDHGGEVIEVEEEQIAKVGLIFSLYSFLSLKSSLDNYQKAVPKTINTNYI